MERFRVAIVGAGIGGIALGAGLLQAGIDDFVILERSDGVGGTWRHNTYPGAACDVPSHLYCFSFAPNPYWSKAYAEQPEILAYLEGCTDDLGLRPHLQTAWSVCRATWTGDTHTWTLEASDGRSVEAGVVVFATGLFGEPRRPDIEGLDSFAGDVVHSARWDQTVDLAKRRVGVIGTGASGAQIIPCVAEVATRTTVFQRTPPYVLPRKDPPFAPEQQQVFASDPAELARVRAELYDAFEGTTAFRRGDPTAALIKEVALEHLRRRVDDADLRDQLTPRYELGCNRTLISSAYYRALVREDVDLVTAAIRTVTPDGVETVDGRLHPLDVLVLATGFHAGEWLHGIAVTGRDGASLHESWRTRARAYLGMAMRGFPNLFVFYGPNTNQGGNSIILILEAQSRYVLGALAAMAEVGAPSLEVRADAEEHYDRELRSALSETVWATGCHSYFTDASGNVVTQLPWTSAAYAERTATFDLDSYEIAPAR